MFVQPPVRKSLEVARQPKQQRSRDRVERILRAAAAELEARGLAEATMTGFAERAGVPIGSVYMFFPTKEAVIAALAERYAADAQVALGAALGPEALAAPVDELARGIVEAMARFHLTQPAYRALSSAEPASPEVQAALGRLRDGWLEQAERLVGARLPHLDAPTRSLVAVTAAHCVDLLRYLPVCVDEAAQRRLVAEASTLLGRYLAVYA